MNAEGTAVETETTAVPQPKAKRKRKVFGRILVLRQKEQDGEFVVNEVQPEIPITNMDAMLKWVDANLKNTSGQFAFARVMRGSVTVVMPTEAVIKFHKS